MEWRKIVTDYLTFSRKDRIAIIVILIIIPVVFFLPVVINYPKENSTNPSDSSWVASMEKLEQKQTDKRQNEPPFDTGNPSNYQYDQSTTTYNRQLKGELFYFDPNTLTLKDWQRLGLRDKTIQTIQNYLNKGGSFKKPGDLKRIYGLFPDEFDRLSPFIRIPTADKITNFQDEPKNTNFLSSVKIYPSKNAVLDINTADTLSLIAFPGIGHKLAARIVNFRDKLGGFYSVDQVAETYGLPDSIFQKIKQYLKADTHTLKKININTTNVDELKAHPYFKWSVAKAIIAYRNQHGVFEKTADIKKVMLVTDEIYDRISPYLYTQ